MRVVLGQRDENTMSVPLAVVKDEDVEDVIEVVNR
jgi:hypothetical protein